MIYKKPSDFLTKPNIKVVYSGRFQPFHVNHFNSLKYLQSKFGKDNVWIGTSNKVDNKKSPLDFEQKKTVITQMFGIPKDRIVQVKNPYNPVEILNEGDVYIAAVGQKDAERLRFPEWRDETNPTTYKDGKGAYWHMIPHQDVSYKGRLVDGTLVREILGGSDESEAKDFFKFLYQKFNPKIFSILRETFLRITESINEGGAAGHLSHIYEDPDLTFEEIQEMISNMFENDFSTVAVKTDGQNIMISVINGEVRAARTGTQIRNFGKTSMTLDELSNKFMGRGAIHEAFTEAMKELQIRISKLSSSKVDEFFKNGKRFVSLEIIYPATENSIPYGHSLLQLHGFLEYDEAGKPVSHFDKKSANEFAEILNSINDKVGLKFKIAAEINPVELNKEWRSKKSEFLKEFSSIVKSNGMKFSNTLSDYVSKKVKEDFLDMGFDETLAERLGLRFATGVGSIITANEIKKTVSADLYQSFKDYKDNWKIKSKEIREPFEIFILKVSAFIIKNLSDITVLDRNLSRQKMIQNLRTSIDNARKMGTDEELKKLEFELNRFNKIGGEESISPMEGLVFSFKGKLYKITGAFAPYNILVNLVRVF